MCLLRMFLKGCVLIMLCTTITIVMGKILPNTLIPTQASEDISVTTVDNETLRPSKNTTKFVMPSINKDVVVSEQPIVENKTQMIGQTKKPDISIDEKNRVTTYSILQTNVVTYQPTNDAIATINLQDATITLNKTTYNEAFLPIMNAINDYINTNNESIVLTLHLQYIDDDNNPSSITIEAFSKKDIGATCQLHVVLSNL